MDRSTDVDLDSASAGATVPTPMVVTDPALERATRPIAALSDAVCKLSLARNLEQIRQVVIVAARELAGADGAALVLAQNNDTTGAKDGCTGPAVDLPRSARSAIMAPVRRDTLLAAIIIYWTSQHTPTRDEVALIQALADTAGIALENLFLSRDLERRVLDRTRALEACNRELASFNSWVAHDLRAPLRHIGAFAHSLDLRYGTQLDPEGTGLIENILLSARRMNALIDSLLRFARSGNGALDVSVVDMRALVEGEARLLCQHLDYPVELEISELPSCRGDRQLLTQVWQNLLSNALKYCARTRNARVQVSSYQLDAETVYFVRDNGVGFDMKYAHKLFEIFQRLHGVEFEGAGVGLAIVQNIILRHGGRVWAQSTSGQGATFHFALPASTGLWQQLG